MSKFVGTGPSSYKKRIYRVAVSQGLRNTALWDVHRFSYCLRACVKYLYKVIVETQSSICRAGVVIGRCN